MTTWRITLGVCFVVVCVVAGGTVLGGCTTEKAAYEAASAEDTAEAMRAFLEQYPDGMYASKARPDLDELDWRDARQADTSEAFEKYLADHPEGIHAQEASIAAPEAAWREMDLSNDAPAIEGFLNKYPHSAFATQAKERLALLEKLPKHVSVGATALARNESGGWTITCPIENVGTVDVTEVCFRVAFAAEGGKIVAETEAFLVQPPPAGADDDDPRYEPLEPGESRPFTFELEPNLAPKGWIEDTDHVRLVASKLAVAS